ncbi:hypothetical protein A5707_01785 [Mycobacterium kyorinense]|uniref:Uncharacterized protein n=1 Tax=Mycobacterium kyorinense TaxID=487514 RepID=A0A1A2Z7R1_9MYCO|nr:hypothetical protein [Mycobacterium kyorinense]OBI45542.1 hypothetical protein A5707_01785 [Mycobacterium kyorinense]
MTDDPVVRRELVSLNLTECERVLDQVKAKGGHCDGCGATEFDVGDALYLGFLFLDEDDDAYMVALTCRNPECPAPRTGIKLREKDFLTRDADAARAASWSVEVPDAV